jgi:spermidine synthase
MALSWRVVFALALTGVTGATGLVYEITWQRYLATLLGAQSEATAAILALFLGGLSLGYALFGSLAHRITSRARNEEAPARLLALYAGCEIGIGLLAGVFPGLFALARGLSVAVPAEPAVLAFALDVVLCAGLILPPAILMGATVPLLTQALSRGLEDATRIHALVYGLNTAGACIGALAGGFLLVPMFGLDGTLLLLGFINIGCGLAYLVLGRGLLGSSQAEALEEDSAQAPSGFVVAAILLGFSMMAIQTVLLRLGGQAFGSSEFTFALVVAIFVLCLAVGSLVVSRFGQIPKWVIVAVPWALVAWLALLYPTLDASGYWVHVVRTWFGDTQGSFYLYQLACAGLLLVAFAIPIGLAGSTLPLLFHFLRREGRELGRVAGRLYAANTVGSVLGALLGGYLLLFWLDLDQIFRLAIASVVLGAAIISLRVLPGTRWVWLVVPSAIGIALLPSWDPERLSAGLFRRRVETPLTYAGPTAFYRNESKEHEVISYADGPVASVAVFDDKPDVGRDRAIIVNGKSDGSLFGEYQTTGLLALVPALFAERAENALVIGFGTGTTVGELAALDSIRRVDAVEISREVLLAAPLFEHGNQGAFSSPKVHHHRSDAYRELIRGDRTYDIIISEPSNPWVTGIEMLFTREIYESARAKLSPGGVYAQWLQAYEIDSATLELVMRTFTSVFEHVAVWYGGPADLLLLGFDREIDAMDLDRLMARAGQSDYAVGLKRSAVHSPVGLLAHEMLPLGTVAATIRPGAIHTLTHPILSHRAAMAFYRKAMPLLPMGISPEARQVGQRNSLLGRYLREQGGEAVWPAVIEAGCGARLRHCAVYFAGWARVAPESMERQSTLEKHREQTNYAPELGAEAIAGLDLLLAGNTFEPERVSVQDALEATDLFLGGYHHAIPFPLDRIAAMWRRCDESGDPYQRCGVGLKETEQFLGPLQ